MASGDTTIPASLPEGGARENEQLTISLTSPKGSAGLCLCSPTKHQGSFRCRFHRSHPSAWMRRSKSMSSASKSTTTVAAKPLETVKKL